MTADRKTILLTGGAGAVGRELIDDLADEYRLIVLDRDETALSELHRAFPEVVTYSCDLTSYGEVCGTLVAMDADGHSVDILINNAGHIHSEPLLNPLKKGDPKHSPTTWRKVIGNNLDSVFHVSSCVAERMVRTRTKGVIINVSSIAAAGNPGQSAYAAAKAAVNALTRVWSRELGPMGIRVTGIAPGFLDVASTRTALPEKYIEQWVRQTPLGRLGTPGEFAHAVRFIIENGYFNGRILELDGGLKI